MNPDPVGPEPRFRALATSAPVGIYELDPRGDRVFVNEHWCPGAPPRSRPEGSPARLPARRRLAI